MLKANLVESSVNSWARKCTYGDIIGRFAVRMLSEPEVSKVYVVGSSIDLKGKKYDFRHDIDFCIITNDNPYPDLVLPREFKGIVDLGIYGADYNIQRHLQEFCNNHFERYSFNHLNFLEIVSN
jgi:predicted nucleotidyltransferase